MEILHRDDLPLGGFQGVREHRLVTASRLFGEHAAPGAWDGLGRFVYLSDARFVPHGETRMHSHREVDVISVILEGRIAHEGSLEHGQELRVGDVQVQRAGGEGFLHNEVNPDEVANHMLQLWVLPEQRGEAAGYRFYQVPVGSVMRVYGGDPSQSQTLPAKTLIDVGRLNAGQQVTTQGPTLAYLASGSGSANGETVTTGDLMRDDNLSYTANASSVIVVVHLDE